MVEKIIVSACLLGDKTKYDGHSNYTPLIKDVKEKFDVIVICPEVNGGLPTPRLPSEIKGDRVINQKGKDVTKYFDKGVDYVTRIVKYFNIKKALLKEKSPSCGVHEVYDGTFSHKVVSGSGWLTRKLKSLGVEVYNENEIEELLNK